jgi:hypothetical protein
MVATDCAALLTHFGHGVCLPSSRRGVASIHVREAHWTSRVVGRSNGGLHAIDVEAMHAWGNHYGNTTLLQRFQADETVFCLISSAQG